MDSLDGGGVPLEEHVVEIEKGIMRGVGAVSFELSQMMALFELLLRREHAWFEQCRRGLSGEVSGHRLEETPDETFSVGELHRLHAFLRKASTKAVYSPSNLNSAPGFYAVYFTDESKGIKVEYVHSAGEGGDS